MMNIFILEDDFIQQTRIESIVVGILKETRIPCNQLEVFSTPQNYLRVSKKEETISCIFRY